MTDKILSLCKAVVAFGSFERNAFGKLYSMEINAEDGPSTHYREVESNLLREISEDDGWKKTVCIGTMEKYEYLFKDDSEFSTIMVSTCGKEWDDLMGKNAIGEKRPRHIHICVYKR